MVQNTLAAMTLERGDLARKKGEALELNRRARGRAAHQGHDREIGKRVQENGVVVVGVRVIVSLLL